MKRRWVLSPPQPALAKELREAFALTPIVADVLAARGFDVERTRSFLDVDLRALVPPDSLPDVDEATARIITALERGERITLYGDYDVDGTTATAILVEFLTALGGTADYYLPDRFREGYGLSVVGMEAIAARGTRLVITADCGTSSFVEIARAGELGMDVIVIDHHQTPKERPAAVALLNPHRHDSAFPDRGLCSAGLAFYLALAVRKQLREAGAFTARPEPGRATNLQNGSFGTGRSEPNLKVALDLVALGTVADVAPLVGLNRVLVHHGLRALRAPWRPGLTALKAVSNMGAREVTSGDVGYRLAPRINAAGRLGDASRAVELMLCRDPARAQVLAEELDRENARRQQIEREVLEAAMEACLADPDHATAPALVVAGEGWHPGVVGIVAARLVDRFARPAVVLGVESGVAKGSARSAGGVHLYDAMGACKELLTKYGGHAAAAGLTLPASAVPAFRHRFREVVGNIELSTRQARRRIDAALPLDAVSLEVIGALDALRPFGEGNPEPVFVAHDVGVTASRIVGGQHLRLNLEGGVTAIGFRMGHELPQVGDRLDLCYWVRVNEWQGTRRAELQLVEPPRPAGEGLA